MAESKYFPNLGNGVDIADVEQVEAAFSAVQADMDKKIEGVADNAITADKIADGAVTTDKIADGSVSADKLNIAVANRLFTGYIEDNVIGDTVDYNALTNLSQTTISGIYHHTVTKGVETNTAIVVVESAEVFDETDTDCKQMLIKSDGKMYVRTHTQSSGWTTFKETYSDTFANINLLLSSLQTDKADKDLAFNGTFNLTYDSDFSWDNFSELNQKKAAGIYKVIVKSTDEADPVNYTAILYAIQSSALGDGHLNKIIEYLVVDGNDIKTRVGTSPGNNDSYTFSDWEDYGVNLANDNVTTNAIKDKSVTLPKLADDVQNMMFNGVVKATVNSTTINWSTLTELKNLTESGIYKVEVSSSADANIQENAILINKYIAGQPPQMEQLLIRADGKGVYERSGQGVLFDFTPVVQDVIGFDGTIHIVNESIDDSAELKNATKIGVYRVLLDTNTTQDTGILINHHKMMSQYIQTLILGGKIYYRTGVSSNGNKVWTTFKAPDLDNDSVTTDTIKDKAVTTAKLNDKAVTAAKIDSNVTNRLFTNEISIDLSDASELDIDNNAALKITINGVYKVEANSDAPGYIYKYSNGILIVDEYPDDGGYEHTLIYNQKTYIRTGTTNDDGDVEWTKFETTDKIKEYGVRWLGTSSTSCTRLGDAKGLVANAYQGSTGTAVVNDFDNIYPWSGMRRCNVNENGDILAYEDDPNFKLDGTNGDVMVEIPKFYYKRTKTGTMEEWWICGTKLPGYELHPLFMDDGKEMSKVFHSCYNASAYTDETDNKVKLRSASGDEPKTRSNMEDFRTYARNKGSIWGMEDLSCISALQMLYLVEYANTNSQTMLGQGCSAMSYSNNVTVATAAENTNSVTLTTNPFLVGQRIEISTALGTADVSTTARNVTSVSGTTVTFDGDPVTVAVGNIVWNVAPLNGTSDSIGNKSGWVKGTNNYPDGKADVRYRGIEGFHGKNYRFIDGCNIKDYQTYYCNSMADYQNAKYDGKYKALGYLNASSDGYAKSWGYDVNAPWVMMTNSVGGSSTTYIPDYYYRNKGGRLLLLGGFWPSGSLAGLFYARCLFAVSDSNLSSGVHLLTKKP